MIKRLVALLVMMAALVAAFSCFGADTENKLKAVEKEIAKTRQAIEAQKAKRSTLRQTLKGIDTQIGKLSARLNQIDQQQAEQTQKRQQLQLQLDDLKKQSQQQQALLVKQLRAAYAMGQDDYLKMMLNLQSLSDLERMMAYYQKFNGVRMDALNALKTTRAKVEATQADLDQAIAKLNALEQEAKSQQASLNQQKSQRQSTINKLSSDIQSQSGQLAQMVADRKALNDAIAEAERKARQSKGKQTLKGQQGRLAWPVKGKVERLFGEKRAAGVEWRGDIIRASEGAKVEAVAGGVVVYANWVRGYGLLMVIQHADGYMSLYGQNQALLKKVGDDVKQGESIALVGRSGGQQEPGLYFEIRHQGKAVNPAKWCR
ncbi:murein hydrolase activator EnvC family protein [Gallaecimonas mangrovi]|uniref:murein hydrolase activator EnvC family protein n=1 Tax=Gallaecimonas mangrovi TaxID=2291597 RepID=UPI000E20300D|nr:peptidoglycan DD-metalloendopeptidase family protein [Gallaecimonas mangrovi]